MGLKASCEWKAEFIRERPGVSPTAGTGARKKDENDPAVTGRVDLEPHLPSARRMRSAEQAAMAA
jgi:hypothetical protein